MKVVSNLLFTESCIDLDLPRTSQPIVFFKKTLKAIEQKENEIILLVLSFVGRRILAKQENIAALVSGRRHRVYIAIKHKNAITIKYGWHKVKRLSLQEINFVNSNWNELFFLNQGKKFVQQSGGCLFFESLLSKYTEC